VGFTKPELLNDSHDVGDFDCGESALDEWLKKHALANQRGGGARVYVTVSEASKVAGYYAISAAEVAPDEATPRSLKGQPSSRPIPVILLGRLAVDREYQGQGVGSGLLKDAMLRCFQVAQEIGVRALVVHAKNKRAREWYEQYGFEPSPTDPLHLILLMKDLKRFLEL
jgi:GNAT superfamily N-acetyltransferase